MALYSTRRGIGPKRDQNGNVDPSVAPVPKRALSPAHDWSSFDDAFHSSRPAAPAAPSRAAVPVAPAVAARPAQQVVTPAGAMAGQGVASVADAFRPATQPQILSRPPQQPAAATGAVPPAPMPQPAPAQVAPSSPVPELTQATPGGQRDANGMVTPQYAQAAIDRTAAANQHIDANRDAYASQLANSGANYVSPQMNMRVSAPGVVTDRDIVVNPNTGGPVTAGSHFTSQYGTASVTAGTGDGSQMTGAPGTLAASQRAAVPSPIAGAASSFTPIGGAAPAPAPVAAPTASLQNAVPTAAPTPLMQGPTQSGVPMDAYASSQQRGAASVEASINAQKQQLAAAQQQQSEALKPIAVGRQAATSKSLETGAALDASDAYTSKQLATNGGTGDPDDEALRKMTQRDEDIAKRNRDEY